MLRGVLGCWIPESLPPKWWRLGRVSRNRCFPDRQEMMWLLWAADHCSCCWGQWVWPPKGLTLTSQPLRMGQKMGLGLGLLTTAE